MQPLADKLRPKKLEEIWGQDHLLGDGAFIPSAIRSQKPLSMILWGPPGCGKTSIARLYAQAFAMDFRSLNAIFSGVADLKKIVHEVKQTPLFSQNCVLFVDEIHRFNKAQQDAFLPFIEDGTIVLIGATAENPSFYLNDALLSRLRVLQLKALDHEALESILERCEEAIGPLKITEEGRKFLLDLSQGDGRYLLNLVENVSVFSSDQLLNVEMLRSRLQKRAPLFDRGSDQHYNLISALHKSVRGSDPDAALYWLGRMLEGGEDPRFIGRRLVRMATEDIGLADPQALTISMAAKDSYEFLGSPEGELGLAQAVVYLALAPKSNAVYKAYQKSREAASKTSQLNPPKHILNAPTRLMKELDYGKGYTYDHDTLIGFSGQSYFPEEMESQEFYKPVERGFEREMKKRLDYFIKKRKSAG
ncbi:replication-associated recombination protein A [Waddlia chondrophila]|uniref:Replication-associated recombination protein A n=1 Tax=Waddlia chondrophila (strain ATCC VR-1470 / WSU 86-1044) TaxID=716544 RepID=D6YTS3_WADCW|nr:recombination factor RarA [Waddlia chondrophila WSU 86-1044]